MTKQQEYLLYRDMIERFISYCYKNKVKEQHVINNTTLLESIDCYKDILGKDIVIFEVKKVLGNESEFMYKICVDSEFMIPVIAKKTFWYYA